MSTEFTIAQKNEGFVSPVGDDKCRYNLTFDRMLQIPYRKGLEPLGVDLMTIDGERVMRACWDIGITGFFKQGMPSSESVTQTERPSGDKWVDCKAEKSSNGKKTVYTRKLDDAEKIEAAIAHVEVRLEMFQGTRELQQRTSNVDEVGEELRLRIVKIALKPTNGLTDSDGNVWTHKTLPSVLCTRPASSSIIETAALELGIGEKTISQLKARAQNIVELRKCDDMDILE